MLTVKHDGEAVAEVADVDAAFTWLLRHQGQSVHYALRYSGYTVVDEDGREPLDITTYRNPPKRGRRS